MQLHSLVPLRAAIFAKEAGKVVSFSQAALRQRFAAGRDLSEGDNVLIAAAACALGVGATVWLLPALFSLYPDALPNDIAPRFQSTALLIMLPVTLAVPLIVELGREAVLGASAEALLKEAAEELIAEAAEPEHSPGHLEAR